MWPALVKLVGFMWWRLELGSHFLSCKLRSTCTSLALYFSRGFRVMLILMAYLNSMQMCLKLTWRWWEPLEPARSSWSGQWWTTTHPSSRPRYWWVMVIHFAEAGSNFYYFISAKSGQFFPFQGLSLVISELIIVLNKLFIIMDTSFLHV